MQIDDLPRSERLQDAEAVNFLHVHWLHLQHPSPCPLPKPRLQIGSLSGGTYYRIC